MSVKLLISGVERSGKSTLTSQIVDALVISFDTKAYPFSVPHVNVEKYQGLGQLLQLINEKVGLYKEKYDRFPNTIVLDTVTALYTMINHYASDRFSGYDIHSTINKDTLGFNDYIENTLIKNGVNVVIVAHTIYDADTSRYIIPASGAFAKSGSWLGTVDNAVYVGIKANKFFAYHKDLKFSCRSTLGEEIPMSSPIEEYDINAHIALLLSKHNDNKEFTL